MEKLLRRITEVSLLVLFLFPSILFGQIFPLEIIKYNGPPDKFMNLVILGDGYTSTQQDKFVQDAKVVTNGFLAEEPFKTFRDSINVYALKVVSNQSGASLNPSNLIDNYFGSSFWSYGIERLLVAWRSNLVMNVLNANTPFYDNGIIMVNDSRYGGSGGQFTVFSTHEQAVELMLHELGHSFSGLADEYWAGNQYAFEKSNMTQNSDPASIKWKDFLDANGVGIYPYEESPTWFRPHQDCKMRYLNRDYCGVCTHKITSDIQALINLNVFGAPVAFFGANKLDVMGGTAVKFYDLTSNEPDKWEWTFEGGTPEISTEKNPVVVFNEPGKFSVTLKAFNDSGDNTFVRENLISVTGFVDVFNIDYTNTVSVFPNPALNQISVVLSDKSLMPTGFRIINSLGKVVASNPFSENINISELSAGVFFLQIESDKQTITKRIVKH
jgi:PKD repeat protein